MKLDGFNVAIGDSVYDLILGAGKVISLHEDGIKSRFTVKFGEYRQLTYDENGFCHYKQRTLYWKNPIVVIPVKQEAIWELQKELCLKTTETIRAKAQLLQK